MADKAYVPYGEAKDILYQPAPQNLPYSLTKNEYAALEENSYVQVNATTRISSSSTVTLYTVPEGFTLYITHSAIQTMPIGPPAAPTSTFTRISFGPPSDLFYINYLEMYFDPAINETMVWKICDRAFTMPLKVESGSVVQASFSGGAAYWASWYQIIGYLEPNPYKK